MTLSSLTFLLMLVMAGLLVRHILGWREQARGIAEQACRAMEVQLLDASVSWRALRFNRRYLSAEVQYRFDFSEDGVARCAGLITLIGGHPVQVAMNSERLGQVLLDPSDFRPT